MYVWDPLRLSTLSAHRRPQCSLCACDSQSTPLQLTQHPLLSLGTRNAHLTLMKTGFSVVKDLGTYNPNHTVNSIKTVNCVCHQHFTKH
jgi:hypothetical protein